MSASTILPGASNDLYEVLGVAPTATYEEIRRAFGERAKATMSDQPRFEAVQAAWEILKDDERRAAYDRKRASMEQFKAAKAAQLGQAQAQTQMPPQTPQEKTRVTRMSEPANDATVAMPSSGPTQMGQTGSTMMGGQTVVASPTMMGFGGGDRTQAVTLPPCPICETPGVPGEEFCVECGFLVGSLAGEEVVSRPLPRLVDATGREFPLKLGENTVGREGADIMIPDRTVSRRHAHIVVEESGTVWMEDLGSTNGTRVGRASVPANRQTTLSDRTAVQFGSIKLTVILPEGFARTLLALPAAASPAAAPVASLPAAGASGTGDDEKASAASAGRLVDKNGREIPLVAARTTVGRRADNSIIISDDAFVSGSHAEIVYDQGKFVLTDLGSTNGTRLNGAPLSPRTPQMLVDGDEMVFGKSAYTFRAPGNG